MAKQQLLEYILHPFGAMQKLFSISRNPETRISIRDGQDIRYRKGRSWLAQYFESMYSRNRIELYASFRELDADPLITSIIDSFAQAGTQTNIESDGEEGGRIVWCQSRNEVVQKIIYKFLDRTQIDSAAYSIMRSLYVYGDHFEAIPGVRGKGVVKFDCYDPWEVAKILDGERRLSGFTQASDRGEPASAGRIIPYHCMLHFRMPERKRTAIYGAESSILYGIREYWQEVQWVKDKILIERMWRNPNRLLILFDIGGMSAEEGFEEIEAMKRRIYRDQYFDPNNGPELSAMPAAFGEQRDVILPTGTDNRTSITPAPAMSSSTNMDDLNMLMRIMLAAIKFPPSYLGLDLGSFDRNTPIEKQDVAFARACMGPQKAFLAEIARAAMIDLVYNGIDPLAEKNQFTLYMTPVSVFAEIERKDLINMRYDLLDRAMRLGTDFKFDEEMWHRYVLKEFAKVPENMIDKLLKKTVPSEDNQQVKSPMSGPTPSPFMSQQNTNTSLLSSTDPGEKKELLEMLSENKKACQALCFLQEGSASVKPRDVILPVPDLEEIPRLPILNERVNLSSEDFERLAETKKKEKAKVRSMLYEAAMTA